MQDLTAGSLTRHLLATTTFMLVSMVFQTLYGLVDLFWVGRLGTDAVAAVGISSNLAVAVLAVSQMLGVGTTTLVSHAVGRKDQTHALFVFNQSQIFSMVILSLWADMMRIGLPAGVEFLLMGLNLAVVYVLARPFGPAAQAGFGVGFRIVQAAFLPVVALGFAVAPVAGQNMGARKPDRVKATFRAGATLAAWSMAAVGLLVYVGAPRLVGLFSRDPGVVATGVEYLHIVVLNFVFSGVTFVSAAMFQAMGNTLPSLLTSLVRLLVVTVPAVLLSSLPGFTLRWIWYLAVVGVILQMTLNLLLLLPREYRVRLAAQ